MMKFNREEGLTLIELLVTIAVIAIVAAIAVPVIGNVVSSTNTRAAEVMGTQMNKFVETYNNVGGFTYNPDTQVFTGYVDINGDGIATANERVEELTVDTTKFTVNMFGDLDWDAGTADAWSDGTEANPTVWINYTLVDAVTGVPIAFNEDGTPVDQAAFDAGVMGVDTANVYQFKSTTDYLVTNWRASVN